MIQKKIRILYFIGSLLVGGKERRLVELLSYLKNKGNYELMVVLYYDEIHFPDFLKMEIPYQVIKRKWDKNDPTIFYNFFKIGKKFKPDIIHTWGSKQTFYALPTVLMLNVPLINSQITSAPPKIKRSLNYWIDRLNFKFSTVILSNSKAGIESFKPPIEKSKVIYNGMNLKRFIDLPLKDHIKAKYKIDTPYAVIMVASVSLNKDYKLFYRIAENIVSERDDITFIGVGGYNEFDPEYKRIKALTLKHSRIFFHGTIKDVEALVNCCQIGILFSNKSVHGEGLSNSIMEYMALGKPVIANDAGGTKELVYHNDNGYLIQDQTEKEISSLLIDLIENEEKRIAFGKKGKMIIEKSFSLEIMGEAFEGIYLSSLQKQGIERRKNIRKHGKPVALFEAIP